LLIVFASVTATSSLSCASVLLCKEGKQWKSEQEEPPRPLRIVGKQFRDDLLDFLKEKKAVSNTTTTSAAQSPAHKESSPPATKEVSPPATKESSSPSTPTTSNKFSSPPAASSPPPPHQNLKDFLSKIVAPADMLDSPSFFMKDMTAESLQRLFLETCKETCALEIKKQKEKKQEAVSAASQAQPFDTTLKPQEYPTLVSKNISLTSNQDIVPVLREIVKLSKQVKSVDILKILNLNDSATSLVEVPSSAKNSGFKKQALRTKWVLSILESVRRCKTKDLLVGDGDEEDEEDNEIAHTNDNAARWLLTYLGEFFPAEFVKSAQALDMPIHRGKVDAAYTAAMWSDAGVGVAAQRIVMKYFMSFFGYNFAVPEASVNKLAVHSVPPIVGRIEHMDRMLDYWYKDLVHLLTGQIANEHESQSAGFSYTRVDFVMYRCMRSHESRIHASR
jgi:hypothetical protein